MQVLVVDDDLVSRRSISETLLMAGFRVSTARNGAEAMRLFTQHDFSIVFTDWKMQVVDGVDFCREIRRCETTGKYTCLIMITSCTEREDIMCGLQAGADHYVLEPFIMADLS